MNRAAWAVACVAIGFGGFVACESGSSPACRCPAPPELPRGVHAVTSAEYSAAGDATVAAELPLDAARVEIQPGEFVVSYQHDGADIRVTYNLTAGP